MNDSISQRFAQVMHQHSKSSAPNSAFNAGIHPASAFHVQGDPSGPYQYGRWANPSWQALEDALSLLEDAQSIIVPSGMATISAIMYTQLKPGDTVLLPGDGYFATRAFTDTFIKPFGIQVRHYLTATAAQADFNGVKMVWIETPSNPELMLCDIAQVVALTRKHGAPGAIVVADNTTMTPLGQRPLELGADVIVNADTKAVNGHSDVVFGHIASRNDALMQQVRDWRKLAGVIPGQFEAWLVHRGLETLELRFDRMCSSAQTIAQRLADHAKVKHVIYPGLSTHPQHALAKQQMLRFGSMISLTLADKTSAEHFINANPYIRAQTSFGGVHSSAERRARWGDPVEPGFVRFSIGCEPTEALWKAIIETLGTM
jgi:cystathionine gamma-lyase